MPRGQHVDTGVIHQLLWERTDRMHRVRIQQFELAAVLGINKFTMSRTMKRLIDEQRIRRLSGGRHNEGQFIVEDPDEWQTLYGTSL